jgi:hypothetical protein
MAGVIGLAILSIIICFLIQSSIQYAIFNDSLVKLECRLKSFGIIEDFPDAFFVY